MYNIQHVHVVHVMLLLLHRTTDCKACCKATSVSCVFGGIPQRAVPVASGPGALFSRTYCRLEGKGFALDPGRNGESSYSTYAHDNATRRRARVGSCTVNNKKDNNDTRRLILSRHTGHGDSRPCGAVVFTFYFILSFTR